jgi:hypothetical protein
MAALFTDLGNTLTRASMSVKPNGTVAIKVCDVDEPIKPVEDDDLDSIRPDFLGLTLAKVKGKERGKSDRPDVAASQVSHTHAAIEKNKQVFERKAIAERLHLLMERVLASHGTVKMAANVAVLRHELSKAHEKIGHSTIESDYLSIITLVESNLASMDWKLAQKSQLKKVAEVLAFGRQNYLVFDDYNKAVKVLRGQMLPTGPSFEIDVHESAQDDE